MKKTALLLYQGTDFQSAGLGKFAKDVLHVGKWIHPSTGQEVVIDRERLHRLAANTEKYRSRQDRQSLAFPDGHTIASDKNFGWWNGPFTVIGDTLYGFVEPTATGVAEKLANRSIRSVSPMIEFNRLDQRGDRYDEVITHVCATPIPVTDGQQDFLKLSQDASGFELFIPQELAGTLPEGNSNFKEGQMDPKELAKALGLPESTPADKILEAAKKASEKLSAAAAQESALALSLKEQGFELKDGKLVKLAAAPPADLSIKPTDSAEVVALKKKLEDATQQLSSQGAALATLLEDGKKARIQNATALAQQLVREGQIPPALAGDVAQLLALQTEVQGLALSADGKPVSANVNPGELARKLLTGLKSITTGGLLALSAEQKDKDKEVDKLVDDVVARIQPQPAGAGTKI